MTQELSDRELKTLLIAAEEHGLELSDLEQIRLQSGMNSADILNKLALTVAEGYLSHALTYEFCDGVMNGIANAIFEVGVVTDLPQPAFSLYQAFDQGEWVRSNDPPDTDPGEKYTRPVVMQIMSSLEVNKKEPPMLRLIWLRDDMQYSNTFAQWVHEQFAYEYVDRPLSDWQREFAEGQVNGDWQCLIAVEDGLLLGGAALAKNDLAERPDIGPWLACVFIAPHARQRGLAEQLIEGICATAKANGNKRLYLHTHDRHEYYAKRGWQVLESFQAWGKEHRLMGRDL